MIQKNSDVIFLFLAFVVTGILPFISAMEHERRKEYFFMQNQFYIILLGLSTTLSVVSLVSYKKRQNQFVMGRLNMILNFIGIVCLSFTKHI
jgi:cell division protein FtsW (lipid II flippase)